MQGRTHLLTGIFLGLLFLPLGNSLLVQVLIFSSAVVGSLIADLDISTSLLGRKVKLIGYLFSHRGFFHSLFFLLLLSIMLAEISVFIVGLTFLIGGLSHLLLDILTKEGLYLWPTKKKIKGYVKVGSVLEQFLQLFLLLAILLTFM